jgi:hypothetical protein
MTQADPPLPVPPREYYAFMHDFIAGLPPPQQDTPEARLARDNAAMAQVAAMLPVNANEAGLAAQCVALRAQAADAMRLIRQHSGDIGIVLKLQAQHVAMTRTSLAAHGHLVRARALRTKREQSDALSHTDEWTMHIAMRSMQDALRVGRGPGGLADAQEVFPPAVVEAGVEVAGLAPDAPAAVGVVAAAVGLPEAAEVPAGAAPEQMGVARGSGRVAVVGEADDPPRDLAEEVDHYAAVYPGRAREIRRHGGLPPDCSFGPPDDALVRALVTWRTPVLLALDDGGAGAD